MYFISAPKCQTQHLLSESVFSKTRLWSFFFLATAEGIFVFCFHYISCFLFPEKLPSFKFKSFFLFFTFRITSHSYCGRISLVSFVALKSLMLKVKLCWIFSLKAFSNICVIPRWIWSKMIFDESILFFVFQFLCDLQCCCVCFFFWAHL